MLNKNVQLSSEELMLIWRDRAIAQTLIEERKFCDPDEAATLDFFIEQAIIIAKDRVGKACELPRNYFAKKDPNYEVRCKPWRSVKL